MTTGRVSEMTPYFVRRRAGHMLCIIETRRLCLYAKIKANLVRLGIGAR